MSGIIFGGNGSNTSEWQRKSAMISSFSFPQLYRCPDTNLWHHIYRDEIPQIWGGTNFRSQGSEDEWLWKEMFSKLPHCDRFAGTFVEIGAFDGVSGSNTHFFEKSLDWRGILIEAHPDNHLRKAQDYRKNTAMFTAAICNASDNFAPQTLFFTKRGGPVGASVADASASYLTTWHMNSTESTYSIDCIPMQYLIDTTGLYDIDLFSLDVEGAELTVLQTINFDLTNIRAIVVELDGLSHVKDQRVRDFLLGHGFIAFSYQSSNVSNARAIRDQCRFRKNKNRGCPDNEVYVNPLFDSKRMKNRLYYEYGTSKKCPIDKRTTALS